MKRQGLKITLAELTKLKNNLIKQTQDLQKKLKIKDWKQVDCNSTYLINIINKSERFYDTWEIEK